MYVSSWSECTTSRPVCFSSLQTSHPSVGDLQVQGKETDSGHRKPQRSCLENSGAPPRKAGWRWVRNMVVRTAVPSLYAGPKPQGTLPLAGLGSVPAVRRELVVL